MAKHTMICHPDTPTKSVEAFEVDVERQENGRIWLRYHVDAPLEALELGSPEEAMRSDGLWQTTCFEAFVRRVGDNCYLEYNFAPSSQWAAYCFEAYRDGMCELDMPFLPETGNDASETHFALEAIFQLPREFENADLSLAVTAVIEEKDGIKSYWSLAHPPGKPDFHNARCFTLDLPAPAAS